MKKLLFIYPEMNIGGSTTSLLSLLRIFDYESYQIDLLLYNRSGELMELVPPNVNVLDSAAVNLSLLSKLLSPSYLFSRIKTLFYKNKPFYNMAYTQIMSYPKAKKLSRKIEGKYDIAVSYLEFWSNVYVAENVKANKKIGWIHSDYIDAGFIPKLDQKTFSKLDYIVLVSEKCKHSFTITFPQLASKAVCINNILSSDFIRDLAKYDSQYKFDHTSLCLVTTCRLTNNSKGLDRGIDALSKLKNEGYKFNWYIIGDGSDREKIEQQINKTQCQDCIHLLGKMNNPYPYLKQGDLFFLPSRYEGKPMAVTEAQMLNVPTIVTDYSSAQEQIKNGSDGIITENTNEGIYMGLKKIFDNPQFLNQFREKLSNTDKSNQDEVEKFYRLLSQNDLF